jgi:hypothetical protein
MLPGILQKCPRVVGVMSINEQHTVLPLGLRTGLFIKYLDPLDANLTIGPPSLRVTKSEGDVSFFFIIQATIHSRCIRRIILLPLHLKCLALEDHGQVVVRFHLRRW